MLITVLVRVISGSDTTLHNNRAELLTTSSSSKPEAIQIVSQLSGKGVLTWMHHPAPSDHFKKWRNDHVTCFWFW